MIVIEKFKKYKIVDRIYKVSNLGRIYNTETGKEIFGMATLKGYRRMYFNNRPAGKKANKFLHVIVAELFVNKIDNAEEVNHKDSNRLNNVFSNLEWLTRADNIRHSFREGNKNHIGNNNPNSKHKQSNKLINRVYQQPSHSNMEGSEASKSCNTGITPSGVKWGTPIK